jgi:hypothetical protein
MRVKVNKNHEIGALNTSPTEIRGHEAAETPGVREI